MKTYLLDLAMVKHVDAGVHLPGGWSESPESDGQRTPEGFEVLPSTDMDLSPCLPWNGIGHSCQQVSASGFNRSHSCGAETTEVIP